MTRILIVADEENIREVVREYAELNGYDADEAQDGFEAIDKVKNGHYDCIILDVMMPRLDGFSACREIRKVSESQIIILSARTEEYDKLFGFELGVDDYVVKPFSPKELMARIEAVLRRAEGSVTENKARRLVFDKLVIDMDAFELLVDGKKVDTPPKEMELLFFLASSPNRVYTRNQLLDEVWGFDYFGDSRTVDVHVKRLREKLEGVSDKWCLRTVWGVGYKFEVL